MITRCASYASYTYYACLNFKRSCEFFSNIIYSYGSYASYTYYINFYVNPVRYIVLCVYICNAYYLIGFAHTIWKNGVCSCSCVAKNFLSALCINVREI